MRIRGLAARWGRDLPSCVALASNFYDFWHDRVMKLMELGVLSMDGEINYDLIRGRARARCAGAGNSRPPLGTWGAGLNCLSDLAREPGYHAAPVVVIAHVLVLLPPERRIRFLRSSPLKRSEKSDHARGRFCLERTSEARPFPHLGYRYAIMLRAEGEYVFKRPFTLSIK